MMKIQHKEQANGGLFYIEEESEQVAQLVYSQDGNETITIEHTEVDRPLRGKNIGYELVHKTVEFARLRNLKVIPLCPFAKAVFDKKPEFRDVLN